jgi:hypothetical protein
MTAPVIGTLLFSYSCVTMGEIRNIVSVSTVETAVDGAVVVSVLAW